jgi:valyl-tRNA synthetase
MRVEGLVDFDAEVARLERTLQKREKEEAGLSARLNNPAFIEKAAPEVIQEAKDALEKLVEANQKTKLAMASLKKIKESQ